MAEPETGTVTTEQAILLLLLEKPAELKALEREGAFKQIAPGRYWIKDLVQGYIRLRGMFARRLSPKRCTRVFSSDEPAHQSTVNRAGLVSTTFCA